MPKKQNKMMKVMETRSQYGELLLKGQEDIDWYNSHFDELVRTFNNQFVAIEDRGVVEADSNLDILFTKLTEKCIDPAETLIKFVSKVKVIL